MSDYQRPPGLGAAQLEHERRQAREPAHARSSCECCCETCHPDDDDDQEDR